MTHPALDPDAWTEAAPDSEVWIADGANVKVTVQDGHLCVEDGVRGKTRTRRLPRVPRTVTRLIVLARNGYISLDALRWCQGAGVAVAHIAEDVTMTSGSGEGDVRVLGAQQSRGLPVSRYLIGQKISGQADTLDFLLGPNKVSGQIRSMAQIGPWSVSRIQTVEGSAAALYWNAWRGIAEVPWSPSDLARVPAHWRSYPGRPTLAMSWQTNRYATDPVNAMLNYAYKILETETLFACRAFGLHPDIGTMHSNGTDRHAFVLDLMEPVRPLCDRIVLRLLRTVAPPRYFDRRWVHEERDGRCVLDPPLSHMIANTAADIGAYAMGYARRVREYLNDGTFQNALSVGAFSRHGGADGLDSDGDN